MLWRFLPPLSQKPASLVCTAKFVATQFGPGIGSEQDDSVFLSLALLVRRSSANEVV